MTLMNGQKIADNRTLKLKDQIDFLVKKQERVPGLAVVLVGDDPASKIYVNSKAKQSKKIGMKSMTIQLDSKISQENLIEEIKTLNNREDVDGILVQLPLPKHLNQAKIIDAISPLKDVDGLHLENIGLLEIGTPRFIPCTPLGIIHLLEEYEYHFEGNDALVIGRSRLVGNPIASLLKNENMTVTQAHSKTKNLREKIKNNDLIVVASGVLNLVSESMLDEHHVVVDVGMHRQENGLFGDVDKAAYNKVKLITPVPKGVGPMTIVSLLENTMLAYNLREGNEYEI